MRNARHRERPNNLTCTHHVSIDNDPKIEYNRRNMILDASLDTSFWNIGSQIGVVPYLFDFFRVHYCQSVGNEIVTTNPEETALVYPQAVLFRLLLEDGRLHLSEPQQPLTRFGVGDAHAIALAHERRWVLLINDARPLAFASSLGISCISVPAFAVFLAAVGRITGPAALGYLQRLRATTSPALIMQAEQVLDELERLRGAVS